MKVKVLVHNPDKVLRETPRDIHKLQRNYDPKLHPFQVNREYVRALNAAKLERVFAKPFVASLDGHGDGIGCMAKHPERLSVLYSGAFDGEVRKWDLTEWKCTRALRAHTGSVRGIVYGCDGNSVWTAGDDGNIKMWAEDRDEPVKTWVSKSNITGLTHHRYEPLIVSCGQHCQLWDETRDRPLKVLQWGSDSLKCVKFNSVESNLLAACCEDRGIILYDVRESVPMRKTVLQMKSNTLCWNPMEAFIFTCANEDYNAYSFDIRKLDHAFNIHADHTSAVIDIDYSPTGQEFVTGSYDRTIRLFPLNKGGHSREVYHTKRMQRLTCVAWSLDNKYILSASDEMNIRIWKAKAWEKLGVVKNRERTALQYCEALKQKFGKHPEVRKILRHRHVPRYIHNNKKDAHHHKEATNRKEANRRAHSKREQKATPSQKKKCVVSQEK